MFVCCTKDASSGELEDPVANSAGELVAKNLRAASGGDVGVGAGSASPRCRVVVVGSCWVGACASGGLMEGC